MNREQVIKTISLNRQELKNSFGVKHLFLFGLVARND